MAFTVNFYSIAKRDNSTLVPSNPIETAQCVLKDGASLLDPVLLLEHSGAPYFSHFAFEGRYYKVTDVRSVRNNLWELGGTVDALASWKSNILATSAFVAYDTTANTEITDRRLSTKTTTTRTESVGTAGDMLGRGYCVAVNTVGESACATYIMELSTAAELLDTLSQTMERLFPSAEESEPEDPDDPDAPSAGVTGTIEEIVSRIDNAITNGFRQLVGSANAADCIKSAFLIPIPYSYISGTLETVKLGIYNTGRRGKRRTSRGIQTSMNVSIPWQATDWRRNAPYTEIYLYIPFLGMLSFPPSALIGATMFNILVAFDETAGDAIFTVSVDTATGGTASKVIGQYTANIAAAFPIGSSNITPAALATTVVGAAAAVGSAVVTGGAAAVAAGTAAIAGEFNSATPLPSSVGSAGGGALLALWGYAPRCMVIFHDTNVAPSSVSAVIGTPTNAVKSLSGLTGYVETRNFSVSGAMTDRERADINRLMDGGVYIE